MKSKKFRREITQSPKRDSLFQKLKAEIAEDIPGFRVLCPTSVHTASIQSMLGNYEVLLEVWEESKLTVKSEQGLFM